MGRPKKHPVEPPESDTSTPAAGVKVVEAKHTITYNTPLTVPAEEPEEPEFFEESEDDSEPVRRPPSLRTRLRDKLQKNGIADTEQLRLKIDRLPLYDQNGRTGIQAEKEFVRTVSCTEAFFTSDDYLEFLQKVGGPGTYWLTLRHKNSIVASWQERIAGQPQNETPTIEGLTGTSNNAVDPSAMMDAFMRQFEKFQKIQAAMLPPWMKQMNPGEMMPAQTQPLTTDSALLALLNSDDALVDAAVGKLKKLLRGDNGLTEEKGPWEAVAAILTSPTLPQTIQMVAAQFRSAAPTAETPPVQHPPQPQQPPVEVQAYQRLLAALTNSLRFNADVDNAIVAVDGFVAMFPEFGPNVNAFLLAPTQELLQGLTQFYPPAADAVQLPHAAEWADKLKTAYFAEPEDKE